MFIGSVACGCRRFDGRPVAAVRSGPGRQEGAAHGAVGLALRGVRAPARAPRSTARASRGTSASSSTATAGGPARHGDAPRAGTRPGADKIEELLGWCEEVGVEVVTLWLLSTDNLTRPRGRARPAARDHRGDASPSSAATGRWRVHPVGALDLLPGHTTRGAEGGRGRDRGHRRADGQRRGRLRRPPRDRRRGALAAAGARRPRARRSRSSPRSSTSSTSPSTSTPRASPTPTW